MHNYAITAHECDAWTTADGLGPGGGIAIRVCGTVDADTGFMSVRARKFDGSSFGNRPYQVRVSQLNDGSSRRRRPEVFKIAQIDTPRSEH